MTKATSIVRFLLLQVHLSLLSPLPLSLRFSCITWQLAGILAHHSLERLGSFGSIFNIAWPILCHRTPCRHICVGIVGGFICRNMPVACSGDRQSIAGAQAGGTPHLCRLLSRTLSLCPTSCRQHVMSQGKSDGCRLCKFLTVVFVKRPS